MLILLAPKMLAYVALLFDGRLRRGCGGAARAALSIMVETVLGGLVAPVAMLIQTMGVMSILMGRDSGWNAQRRDDGGVSPLQNARLYLGYTIFGVVLGVAAWVVSLSLFLWMLPVLLGLVLAIPLAILTGSRVAGQDLRRAGLLLIPEETSPPDVLARAVRNLSDMAGRPIGDALLVLRAHPALLALHCAMLPPPRHRGGAIDANLLVGLVKLREVPDLQAARTTLSAREKAAVLGNAEGLHLLEALS